MISMNEPVKYSGYSLRTRLLLAFGVLLVFFLGLAGLVLDRAFKESVAAAVEERLQLQIYALLGVAEPEGEGFFLPDLEEARFAQINSGLYGFVLDDQGGEVWHSASALELDLAQAGFLNPSMEPGEIRYGALETAGQGRLSYAVYGTLWANSDRAFNFMVLESAEPTAAEIREFQSNLYLWFGVLAVFLSIAQFWLLHWGLKPLQGLAAEVAVIEAGEKDQLEQQYPPELQAVSDNLNLLIRNERERQERYRATLGDLAHSLKTPLAVISGAVQQADASASQPAKVMGEVKEQLKLMNRIVSYQLKRAIRSDRAQYLGRPIRAAPVVQKIIAALDKVYRDKAIQAQLTLQEDAAFHGEESDFMELSGNLLDNAFKYCEKQVQVGVSQKGKELTMVINDDGDGIAEKDRQLVLQRGARGDTLKSGHGIGLAVAVDIVSSYKGEIRVDKGELGGARVRVKFPPSR